MRGGMAGRGFNAPKLSLQFRDSKELATAAAEALSMSRRPFGGISARAPDGKNSVRKSARIYLDDRAGLLALLVSRAGSHYWRDVYRVFDNSRTPLTGCSVSHGGPIQRPPAQRRNDQYIKTAGEEARRLAMKKGGIMTPCQTACLFCSSVRTYLVGVCSKLPPFSRSEQTLGLLGVQETLGKRQDKAQFLGYGRSWKLNYS